MTTLKNQLNMSNKTGEMIYFFKCRICNSSIILYFSISIYIYSSISHFISHLWYGLLRLFQMLFIYFGYSKNNKIPKKKNS